VILNAPRQLLQSGVRAVETTTASGMETIYRIRTRRPHMCARTPARKPRPSTEMGGFSHGFSGRRFADVTSPDVD
jgi:hypothetical protein